MGSTPATPTRLRVIRRTGDVHFLEAEKECKPVVKGKILGGGFRKSLGDFSQVSGAGSVCQPGTSITNVLCTNLIKGLNTYLVAQLGRAID